MKNKFSNLYEVRGHNKLLLEYSRSEEAYGDWNESCSWHWHPVKSHLVKSEHGDVVTNSNKDTLYLLYAIYSSGDSFGHSEEGNVEYIGVFETECLANEVKDNLAKIKNWRETFYWQDEQGDSHDLGFVPWTGYFERLNYFDVVPLSVRSV